jgi:hypothetical protein
MALLPVLDAFLGFLFSFLTALIVFWVVGPEWNGLLAMGFGMAVGMIVPCLALFIPLPFFADFEVMIPGMMNCMVTGMAVPMLIPMFAVDYPFLVALSAGITVLNQMAFILYDKRVHGPVAVPHSGENPE